MSWIGWTVVGFMLAWLLLCHINILILTRWVKRLGRAGKPHIHGAWCHPSADGCPDRPGA